MKQQTASNGPGSGIVAGMVAAMAPSRTAWCVAVVQIEGDTLAHRCRSSCWQAWTSTWRAPRHIQGRYLEWPWLHVCLILILILILIVIMVLVLPPPLPSRVAVAARPAGCSRRTSTSTARAATRCATAPTCCTRCLPACGSCGSCGSMILPFTTSRYVVPPVAGWVGWGRGVGLAGRRGGLQVWLGQANRRPCRHRRNALRSDHAVWRHARC